MSIVREAAPDLDIHISTQANIVNSRSANVWYSMGAKRVVLARELCREEVCQIRKSHTPDLSLKCLSTAQCAYPIPDGAF